jgi:cell division protein ZapA (FtsZ GTPase activity inhibitor)
MLTLTIKTTTPEAADRLIKALAAVLTPAELQAFQEKIASELAKVEKAKKSKRRAKR